MADTQSSLRQANDMVVKMVTDAESVAQGVVEIVSSKDNLINTLYHRLNQALIAPEMAKAHAAAAIAEFQSMIQSSRDHAAGVTSKADSIADAARKVDAHLTAAFDSLLPSAEAAPTAVLANVPAGLSPKSALPPLNTSPVMHPDADKA